ncbi:MULTISPECIES: hypothetical protein [Olivibacter]|uniref:Uncharacterized protein n=1 Tax=Olivibacter jilunii TaxID=985016 RepID=A0ABW6AZK6_9SPHI
MKILFILFTFLQIFALPSFAQLVSTKDSADYIFKTFQYPIRSMYAGNSPQSMENLQQELRFGLNQQHIFMMRSLKSACAPGGTDTSTRYFNEVPFIIYI